MVLGRPARKLPPQSKLGPAPWISMTTALTAMSVPLNALRWSSLGIRGDPSCLDLGFCLTPATQGSTRRICTEGRECTTHHTRNRTSMICELHTPNASCSRKQHVCGEDEEAVAWRPCTTRQAESLFALRVKMTVPEGDVHKPFTTVRSDLAACTMVALINTFLIRETCHCDASLLKLRCPRGGPKPYHWSETRKTFRQKRSIIYHESSRTQQ